VRSPKLPAANDSRRAYAPHGIRTLAGRGGTGWGGLAEPTLPTDVRDFVVVCHEAHAAVGADGFELSDLVRGRVDLMARCASASLFYSHGVRKA